MKRTTGIGWRLAATLLVALVLVGGGLGVGYALQTGGGPGGFVQTSAASDTYFSFAVSDDDGHEDNAGDYNPIDPGDNGKDPRQHPQQVGASCSRYSTDTARTTVSPAGGPGVHTFNVVMDNAYPGYHPTIFFGIRNAYITAGAITSVEIRNSWPLLISPRLTVSWDVLRYGGEEIGRLDIAVQAAAQPHTTYSFTVIINIQGASLAMKDYRWSYVHTPWYSWSSPTILNSWQQALVQNIGQDTAFSVTATITWAPPNVTIVDGVVSFGDVPAGSSAWSIDDFALSTDVSMPSAPEPGIVWKIEYDDALGRHHVIENVPQFPPAN